MPNLRVATLNIWGRQGPWEQRREVLRAQLRALDVDLLGLQEVLRFDAPTSGASPGATAATAVTTDQALELADGLALSSAYGAALDLGYGYSFGNAILSRFPLSDVLTTALPTASASEPRSLVSALAHTPFGTVLFCSTHLAWRFDEGALRLRQVLAVSAVVERRRAESRYPAILVGDFNAEPDADEIRFLRGLHVAGGISTYFIDAFGEVGAGAGATFCGENEFAAIMNEPDRRIDYVFVRGRDTSGLGRPTRSALAFAERLAPSPGEKPIFGSDHFGVVAELRAPDLGSDRSSEAVIA